MSGLDLVLGPIFMVIALTPLNNDYVPVTLPSEISNMNSSQLSLTLTLSILTLSSCFTAIGFVLALERTRY